MYSKLIRLLWMVSVLFIEGSDPHTTVELLGRFIIEGGRKKKSKHGNNLSISKKKFIQFQKK
jgi:hypothetical protein